MTRRTSRSSRPSRPARRAGFAAGVLVLSTLPLVGVVAAAAPAGADEGCLTETASFPGSRCDDSLAPETTVTGVQPMANAKGYLAQNSLTIEFAGAHLDADADPIALECQLYNTATAPTSWDTCTSPITYSDLAQTGTVPYTFRARAIDTADSRIDATAGGLFQPSPADTDVVDLDQTPASTSFFVDSIAPNTFVFDTPQDADSPDFPMIRQRALALRLKSSEDDATFTCTIGGTEVPCQAGPNRFSGLRPGNQVLRAFTVDPAGNVDTTPTVTPFSVPLNLGTRHARGWSLVKDQARYFSRDYLTSTRRGAQIVVQATNATEMRILAPTGPSYGVVEMRVGGEHKPWVALDQDTTSTKKLAVIDQRFFAGRFTGPITFRVARAGKARPAVLDAVLLH